MTPSAMLKRQGPDAERVRVLFVMIHMVGMGGTERLIYNLVRNLDRRVFEPSVAWFNHEEPMQEFRDLHVPLHYVPKRARFDWSAMRKLARIVRDERIDVVNAHHFMSFFYSYYGAKVANRSRLVFTEHSEADVLAAAGKWRVIGGQLLKSSDVAVGISEHVSDTMASHFRVGRDRIRTIANGVDVEMFSADPEQKVRLRNEFGFAADDVVFGLVANFRRNKNHLFLLKAFKDVVRERPNVKLVFVGLGFATDPENSEPDAIAFVRENGLTDSVRFLGYRPNVQELLRMLDVFCLVSYKEGLPLSLIEAMATGLPVIGTDIPSIRAVIEPELNGLTAAPDDVPALAAALRRLAADSPLRHRMAESSRALAQEKYSLRRCMQETQDLFLSLVPDRTVALQVGHSPIA